MIPHRVSTLAGLATCALLGAGRIAAQQSRYSVYADVGAISSLSNLNTAATASLNGGLAIGGGLNWQMVRTDSSLVLQGDVTWVRKTLQTVKAGDGTKVDLVFVGANIEYTWTQARRAQFTILGGGGVVAIHPEDSTAVTRARPFARLGLGARYRLRHSLHAFVQVLGLIYDMQGFPSPSVLSPYSHRQSEVGFGAGLALGF